VYEHRHEPLLPRAAFARRFLHHLAVAGVIVVGSLAVGVAGYHFVARLSWIDALVNAAMLLGGMGPVNELHSGAAKLFAALYALYAGLIFLIVAGVVFAPVFHRVVHRFHLELTDEDEGAGR